MKVLCLFLMSGFLGFGAVHAQESPQPEKLHTLKGKVDLRDVAKNWEDRGFAGPEVPAPLWFAISKLAQETAVLSANTSHSHQLLNQIARAQAIAQVAAELQAQLVSGLPDRVVIHMKLAKIEEDFRNFSSSFKHHSHLPQALVHSANESSEALRAALLEYEKLQ